MRKNERGFALLLIFFMAAAIALTLYTQMPRVAFESERDKEQLLIDRGEQYKRAILLYYNDNKRYPAKIEDLENTNNHRYLRRRYVDPYTGKDEWRLVHTNGMFLTDSLVQKPPANPANSPNGTSQGQTALASAAGPGGIGTSPGGIGTSPGGFGATSGTNPGGFGAPAASPAPANPNGPNNPPQVNAAVLARPSDRTLVPAGGFSSPFPTAPNTSINSPSNTGYIDPASYPPITLYPNGYNASSTGTAAGQNPAQPGIVQPGGFQPGVQPGVGQTTGQFQPGALQGQFQPGALPGQFQVTGQFQPGQTQPGQFQSGNTSTANANTAFQTAPGGFNTQTTNSQTAFGTQTLPPGVSLPGVPGISTGSTPTVQPQSNVPPDPNNPANNGVNANNGFNNGNNSVGNTPNATNPVNPVNPSQPGFTGNTPVPFPTPQSPGGNAGATNPAVALINQQLQTPRQLPSTLAGNNNNQTVGGGIAGVASTFTGPTIKAYLDHTKYEEWEFIFQPQQQQAAPAQANPLGAQTGNGNNSNNSGGTSSGFNPNQFAIPGTPQSGTPGTPQPGLPGLPALPGQPPSQPTGFPQQ